VEAETFYSYQACYCSICRKTAGGGGYAINLGADANMLEVEGNEHLFVYHAKLYDRGGPDEVPASGKKTKLEPPTPPAWSRRPPGSPGMGNPRSEPVPRADHPESH
jgi:hypothetical protein